MTNQVAHVNDLEPGAFTCVVYRGKQAAKVGAADALSHRLFVSGWELNARLHMLVRGRHRYKDATVVIGLLYGEPITVAVYEKTVMMFCRKKYRRRGFGSKTLKTLLKHVKDGAQPVVAREGMEGSVGFWRKHKIDVIHFRGFASC